MADRAMAARRALGRAQTSDLQEQVVVIRDARSLSAMRIGDPLTRHCVAVTLAYVKSMLPVPPPASIRSWACWTFPSVMFAAFHALK
jgi:hypothetical protein